MLRRYQWESLLLLNLGAIHTRSNCLCWKAQEKFQVESRFCKTIGCSYVTLLTKYLAKKTMFKVSNRNTRKRCLLITKLTLKISDWRHQTISYLLEVTAQNHFLDSFSQNIYQFAIKSLLSVLLSSSTARNFNNSRPIYVILWEMRNHYRNIWFMKNSKCQHFLFLKNSPKNGQIFQLFTLYSKGRHFSITKLDILIFCNVLHLEMDFWNLSLKRIASS